MNSNLELIVTLGFLTIIILNILLLIILNNISKITTLSTFNVNIDKTAEVLKILEFISDLYIETIYKPNLLKITHTYDRKSKKYLEELSNLNSIFVKDIISKYLTSDIKTYLLKYVYTEDTLILFLLSKIENLESGK